MGELREPLRELTACGLPEALEVMGERWSFMILRASFNGLHHFRPDDARQILADAAYQTVLTRFSARAQIDILEGYYQEAIDHFVAAG